jgi:hypothetical protein
MPPGSCHRAPESCSTNETQDAPSGVDSCYRHGYLGTRPWYARNGLRGLSLDIGSSGEARTWPATSGRAWVRYRVVELGPRIDRQHLRTDNIALRARHATPRVHPRTRDPASHSWHVSTMLTISSPNLPSNPGESASGVTFTSCPYRATHGAPPDWHPTAGVRGRVHVLAGSVVRGHFADGGVGVGRFLSGRLRSSRTPNMLQQPPEGRNGPARLSSIRADCQAHFQPVVRLHRQSRIAGW